MSHVAVIQNNAISSKGKKITFYEYGDDRLIELGYFPSNFIVTSCECGNTVTEKYHPSWGTPSEWAEIVRARKCEYCDFEGENNA